MLELARGQRVKLSDLSSETRFKLTSHVDGPDASDLVFAAMLLDEKGVGFTPTSIVTDDQQVSACGSIVIKPRQGAAQSFEVDLSRVPAEVHSLMFAFGVVGASKKRSGPAAVIAGGHWTVEASGSAVARFGFSRSDIGEDTAVMLGEIYRKSGAWRMRSVGDGFTGGLPTMLSRFRITPGAVSSTSPGGSLVLGAAPAGLWLPKAWPGNVQPAVPKDLTRSVGLTITRTEDGSVHTGTGFMVSPGGHFVTCHHVVHDAVDLSVAFGGSNTLRKATVVALDQESDLALCCVEDRNGTPDWLLPVGPDVTPGLGDELGLLGYPLGVDLGMSVTYSQGIVNSLRKKQGVNVLQIDVGAAPGSSGGPVFRQSDGQVVGVLTSGLNFADRGMLINFAVDIRTLWTLGWMQRLSWIIDMVDLDKKAPPKLVSLAKSARVVLEKRKLDQHVAAVGLCMDISASMTPLFKGGVVQGIIERVLGLGLNFDDNGAIDVFSFGLQGHNLGEFKATDFAGAANRILEKTPLEAGTCYAPVIRSVLSHYGFKTGGFLSGMFGGGKPAAPRKDPVYMLFVTDGENSNQAEARKAIIDASKHPVFFQFVGIGAGGFKFLKELDTMEGRFIDNANFFEVSNPMSMPETELYEKMTAEYPSWIQLAKDKNLIVK